MYDVEWEQYKDCLENKKQFTPAECQRERTSLGVEFAVVSEVFKVWDESESSMVNW